MRLTCPCCGAVASAEAWNNDAMARSCLQSITKMPAAVQDLVLPYLGLFRTGKNGLTWTRAYKLIAEIQRIVEPGTVQWEGSETRPCPPHVWQAAFNAVLERRPTALSNHNYLRKTAWDMAQGLAAQRERQVEQERRGLGDRTLVIRDPGEGDPPASEEDRKRVQDMLRQFTGRMGGG